MPKSILIHIFILFCSLQGKAQVGILNNDSVHAKFRLAISPFQFAYGLGGSGLNGNLSDESGYLLETTSKGFGGFQLDIQAIFSDKIGVDTGFDIVNGSINQNAIRKGFQSHVTDYTVSFKPNNPQTGYSPFNNKMAYRIFKLGILGYLPRKHLVFIPYTDFLYTIESDYPSVKIDFTSTQNGVIFQREYQFYNTNSLGFKTGGSMRWLYKNGNPKRKHMHLYMQMRTEFIFLRNKGFSTFIDTDSNQNETKTPNQSFNQNHYAFVIGFTLGGLDLNW